MSYRMRQTGFRLTLDPAVASRHYIRATLPSFLHQKSANGFWIGQTLKIAPRCVGRGNLVPALFCFALLLCIILGTLVSWWTLVALIVVYLLVAAAATVQAASKAERPSLSLVALPLLFLATHIGYGLGTFWGLLRIL
jgi:hypothetical protein